MAQALPPTGRRASMSDVALVAGVSGQTVSRVANGRTNVDAETRDRVLAAMLEVGYVPNRAARAVRSGQSRTLGVLAFSMSSFGNTQTLESIAAAATEADFALALTPLVVPTRQGIVEALTRLQGQAVDGVILLLETHLLDRVDVQLPAGLPVVVVDSLASTEHPVVDADQAGGARAATEHLLQLGHDTVWHVTGPADSFSAARRRDAWADTLRRWGRAVPPPIAGDWSSRSGYAAGRVLAADPSVTAVFTANDQMATGVLRALHESGRGVPADVSVVGFDDSAESADLWPPLTTVHQDFASLGRRAVGALLDVVAGQDVPSAIVVPTRLVVRESSGPRTG